MLDLQDKLFEFSATSNLHISAVRCVLGRGGGEGSIESQWTDVKTE